VPTETVYQMGKESQEKEEIFFKNLIIFGGRQEKLQWEGRSIVLRNSGRQSGEEKQNMRDGGNGGTPAGEEAPMKTEGRKLPGAYHP